MLNIHNKSSFQTVYYCLLPPLCLETSQWRLAESRQFERPLSCLANGKLESRCVVVSGCDRPLELFGTVAL